MEVLLELKKEEPESLFLEETSNGKEILLNQL